MAWWVTPALVGGLMLYAKSKASAAFTWILSDETTVKGMPIALLLAKLESGTALPAAPAGNSWKQIEISFASSPFSTPQTLMVNVLLPTPTVTPGTPGLAPTSAVTGVSGFLTSQALLAQAKSQGMSGFLTKQEILPAGLQGFFSKQELEAATAMGEVLDRAKYLYAPQTAPDFGRLGTPVPADWCGVSPYKGPPANGSSVLGKLGAELKTKGLILAPVGPHGICRGDYVVTSDGALHKATGHGQFTRIHPAGGGTGPLTKPFHSAYGIRRA